MLRTIRDMLNCDVLEKGKGLVSPIHFVNDFSRNIFLMLCSINWTNLFSITFASPDIWQYVYSNCF